jgi:hypothetical protein
VEIRLVALSGGSLHLGSSQGAELKPQPLPYAVDVDVTE